MNNLKVDDITVVILAGGKGRRMGGKDKGLVHYKNHSLVKHVIDAISLQADNIIINANRNLDEYAAFGYPVVEDTLSGFQGPLAGFMAAMSRATTETILTLPCDGPVIVDDYVEKMMLAMNQSSCDIVIASDGQRIQPVYALIPVRLKQSLARFLAAGDRKIDLWYAQHQTSLVEFAEDTGLFTNINTPEELTK